MKGNSRLWIQGLALAALGTGCQAPSIAPTGSSGTANPVVTSASQPSIPLSDLPAPATPPASTTPPTALVYGGPGVLYGADDTLARAKSVAATAGFKVIEVDGPVDPAVLNSASVWVQPGGPNLSADSYMNGNGMADQVRDFVRRGGGYVGFCGGAFSAVNNLGLIPGSAYNLDQATEKVPINWQGTTRYIHFEHGPYLMLSDKSTEVVGTYTNGSVAVARGYYGQGKVFISGVHPEAGPGWPPTYDPDGSDVSYAVGMIRYVAGRPAP